MKEERFMTGEEIRQSAKDELEQIRKITDEEMLKYFSRGVRVEGITFDICAICSASVVAELSLLETHIRWHRTPHKRGIELT